MEWRELWLSVSVGRMEGCNMNLLNYVLSHAGFPVQVRVNRAQRKVDGASLNAE